MPYTVLVGGISVQCDTAEEAIELVKLSSGGASSDGKASSGGGGGSGGSRWTDQRIKEFFGYIKGNQRRVIDALLENPDGRTDDQLLQLLGLPNAGSLAGVITGLYKNAAKVGVDPKDLYTKTTVTVGERQMNEYTLSQAFRRAAGNQKKT